MHKRLIALLAVMLLAGCQQASTPAKSSATHSSNQSSAKPTQEAQAAPVLPFESATPLTHVAYISDLYGQAMGFSIDKAGYYLRLNADGQFWLRVAGTFAAPANTGNGLAQSKRGLKTDTLYIGHYDQVAPGKMRLTLDGQIAYLFKRYTTTRHVVDSAFATKQYAALVRAHTTRQVVTWPLVSARERLGFPLTLTRQAGQVSLHILDDNQTVAYPLAKSDGLVPVTGPQAFVEQYAQD